MTKPAASPEPIKKPSKWSKFLNKVGEAIGQAKFGG